LPALPAFGHINLQDLINRKFLLKASASILARA
jgi:hypothetical protein